MLQTNWQRTQERIGKNRCNSCNSPLVVNLAGENVIVSPASAFDHSVLLASLLEIVATWTSSTIEALACHAMMLLEFHGVLTFPPPLTISLLLLRTRFPALIQVAKSQICLQ